MRNSIYIVVLIITSSLSCSNTGRFLEKDKPIKITIQESDYISWDKDYKLTWDDFKGKNDSDQEYAATTWTIVKRNQTGLLEDKIFLTVNNFFLKEQSWVKEVSKNEELLRHERLHWDITEYFTRKLRKIYTEHQSLSINDSYIFFNKEYDDMLEEENIFQNQYDEETNFSRDKEKQDEWENKIEGLLKEYEDYSNVNIEIKRIIKK